MPEDNPAPSNAPKSSAETSADRPRSESPTPPASRPSPQPSRPKRKSVLEQGIQGKVLATLKVQGGRLLKNAGEGLLAYGTWLQKQTSETDEANAKDVSQSVLQQFGKGWKKWSQLLEQMRSPLPRRWRSRLTDSRFTGLLVGLLVFLWVALSSGGSGAETPRTETPRTVDRTPPAAVRRQPKPVQPTVKSRPYEGPAKASEVKPPTASTDPFEQASAVEGASGEVAPSPESTALELTALETSAPEPLAGVRTESEDGSDEPASDEPVVEAIADPSPLPEATPALAQQPLETEESEITTPETGNPETANLLTDNPLAENPEEQNSEETLLEEQTESPSEPFQLDDASEAPGAEEAEENETAIATDTPPEPPPLTAEQKRIAEIRSHLDAATQSPELIGSVEAPTFRQELLLRLTPAWFELPYDEQDRQAQTLYRAAKSLNFSTLRILDQENTPLVRKPVIGEGVIILKRRA